MRINFIPFSFELDTVSLAGSCIWSLGLYIGLDSIKQWISDRLERWFNFAEGWMYTSAEEFEETRPAREAQNAFYASVFSIIPFLVAGALTNWAIDVSFGGSSWAIALGIMTCAICGLFALANQDYSDTEDED
ncbi:hypothetical protein IQ255_13580 [Pleurocapsales cyanobacterium LEGE 10410]|nr:hypothetical protein [Pleurocapsales cyanobacterium LEGE 10410]